ncbi:MAG TPA: GNAT family N-acetyltransferase [Roseiarcus sp.]|nr:GNAT family N-acetyltransferase [Roseiarcus sp.]
MDADVAALERIEREAWLSLAEAAPPDFAKSVGFECAPIGGALFMMMSRIPALQFNWLAGAGLEADDSEAVGEAVARFRAAGQTKFIIQIPPGPHAQWTAARAQEEGLIEHPLAWAKFRRETKNARQFGFDGDIRDASQGEAELFAATAVAAFGMPPPMTAWLKEIVGRPRWRCFLSFIDGAPAGVGALFVDGDYAWIGVGATKREARRLGSHSALIARRIEEARRLGARWAVTETGVPQEGQPAPSYKNIRNAGFSIAYVRPNWAPPPNP